MARIDELHVKLDENNRNLEKANAGSEHFNKFRSRAGGIANQATIGKIRVEIRKLNEEHEIIAREITKIEHPEFYAILYGDS